MAAKDATPPAGSQVRALCVIDRDGERALGGPHRRVAEIGRVERHEPRRADTRKYRPIGPLQQADAGARPIPLAANRLRGTMRQTRNVGRRESAETLGLGQRRVWHENA